MKQGKKRDSRRKAAADVDMSTRDRATFVVNMFREFPEKAFALKQLVAATGDNSREARYAALRRRGRHGILGRRIRARRGARKRYIR